MEEGTGICRKAKAHRAERTGDQRVAVPMCDARGGFRKQVTDRVQGCAVGNKVDAFPMSPLKPSLFPLPAREELRSLFQARAKLPPVCWAVTGLEGTSQQALQRSRAVRRAFASGFASVKRKAPCCQIKLQGVSGSPVPMESWLSLPHTPPLLHHLPASSLTSPGNLEGQASPHTPQKRKPRLRIAQKLGHAAK